MLPTVVDLWPDCDLLAIDDGVTVVIVAEWDFASLSTASVFAILQG